MDSTKPDYESLAYLIRDSLRPLDVLQSSGDDIRISFDEDEAMVIAGRRHKDVYVEIITDEDAYIQSVQPRLWWFGRIEQTYNLDVLVRVRTEFAALSANEAILASLAVVRAVHEATWLPIFWCDTNFTFDVVKRAIWGRWENDLTLLRVPMSVSYQVDRKSYHRTDYTGGIGIGFP